MKTSIIAATKILSSLLICICVIFFSSLSFKYYYLLLTIPFLIKPKETLYAFLFLLPLFGNRPGTEQYLSFTLVSALIVFTSGLRDLSARRTIAIPFNNSLIQISYVYLLIALLSLSSLPWHEIAIKFPNFFQFGDLHDTFNSIYRLISADELKEFYPFTAIINLYLAINIACQFFRYTCENINFAIRSFASILGGLTLSLLAGLLDYYELINLRFLRDLDPVVNPGDIQFRLQSFFGHSGWYAEYLTFCMPLAITALLLPIKFTYRFILCLILMIIGEYVLILTYQRGGWLSYPLTLFVVWTAIYIFKLYEDGRSESFLKLFKSALKKILISLPITIVISLVLVKVIAGDQAQKLIDKYKYRVAEIANTNDRTEFIKAGFDFGLLHPILGGGIDSFALQYEREVAAKDGRLFNKYNLPLHGSAHNFYMQIFSGTGMLGLLSILSLMFIVIRTSILNLKEQKKLPLNKLSILLSSIGFITAIAIYGMVQEIFYVQVLQVLFFTVLFIFSAVFNDLLLSTGLKSKLFLILLTASGLHLFWLNTFPASNSVADFGCYRTETEPDGRKFKWCGPAALISIKNRENFLLKIQNSASPAEIKIFTDQKLNKVIQLSGGELKQERIALRANQEMLNNAIILKSTNYFVPAKTIAGSKDKRVLSFKLYE